MALDRPVTPVARHPTHPPPRVPGVDVALAGGPMTGGDCLLNGGSRAVAAWGNGALRLGCALALLSGSLALAGPFDDERLDTACPDAVREMARLQVSRPPQAVAPVTRPALQKELVQLGADDQAVRARWIDAMNANGAELSGVDPASLDLQRVDAANLRRLRHILRQDGFPTPAMVGTDGVEAAFLITQHAQDAAFQQKVLRIIAPRLTSGGIDGQQYALLTDRVLDHQGRKQRYGTQFEGRGETLKARPIADEAHVDDRRRALGLVSMRNYECMLHAMYDAH